MQRLWIVGLVAALLAITGCGREPGANDGAAEGDGAVSSEASPAAPSTLTGTIKGDG